MQTVHIGNDIVDLTCEWSQKKVEDRRFIQRILSSSEIKYLQQTTTPLFYLWICWSAKEAAYKVLKKFNNDTVFSPANYKVTLDYDNLHQEIKDAKKFTGQVINGKNRVTVSWKLTSQYIHCLGIRQEYESQLENVKFSIKNKSFYKSFSSKYDRLASNENTSIHSEESKFVRILAKEMLTHIGIKNVEIIRDKVENSFSPPYVMNHGSKVPNLDISLSHDGKFLAAALYSP